MSLQIQGMVDQKLKPVIQKSAKNRKKTNINNSQLRLSAQDLQRSIEMTPEDYQNQFRDIYKLL